MIPAAPPQEDAVAASVQTTRVADAAPSCEGEIVAALAKQLKLEEAVVERIFMAGVDHATRAAKRRRLSQPCRSDIGETSASLPTAPEALAVETAASQFGFSTSVTLEDIRRELAEFALERDWDQFHAPRNLVMAMVGEVGELCECFQWRGEVGEGLPGWSEKDKAHLSQEIADVLLYLCRLSHKCRIDLPQAALDKLMLNAAKYPAAMVRGSSKKYNEYRVGSQVEGSATR
mmetsp:Transcript_121654/g.338932  ORF Transcript_121654/g.338932 Transcript_121654/m.338932 type:complete len:232 (-) Transcript_121654:67-762(-)